MKLNNEVEGDSNVLRYFIEVLPSYDKKTILSLKGKLNANEGDNKAEFRCYALEGKSQRGKQDDEKRGEDISDKF